MGVLFIVLIVVAFLIVKHHKEQKLIETVTEKGRGERSERRSVLALLKMGIDQRAIFHDCYLKHASGAYTQIDLVVATPKGLIVIEEKDYSGWIFGNSRQKYWTQILAYGREKHRFYNPIMQNKGHINAIRENLHQNHGIPIYSVIIFDGSSILKDVTIEENHVYLIYPRELKRTIESIMLMPNANYGNKHEIMNVFTQAVRNGKNPNIINAQRCTAAYASYNKPESTYSYRPFRFLRWRRHW